MNVAIIGHFGRNTSRIGGQTMKTMAISRLLSECYGSSSVREIDTGLLKAWRVSWVNLYRDIAHASVLVVIPGQRALHRLLPVVFFVSLCARTRLVVIPVGGRLIEEMQGRRLTRAVLRSAYAVLPQANGMTFKLRETYGIKRAFTLPNFREHEVKRGVYRSGRQLRLVYLGRITRDKGIEILLKAVTMSRASGADVRLDVWGPVTDDYAGRFLRLLEKTGITDYRGVLSQSEIGSTLPAYDALVLPTMHKTEGIPGSIIDAFICGIPALASDWRHIPEVVTHEVNGLLFPAGDAAALSAALTRLFADRTLLRGLRKGAAESGLNYTSRAARDVLLGILGPEGK